MTSCWLAGPTSGYDELLGHDDAVVAESYSFGWKIT